MTDQELVAVTLKTPDAFASLVERYEEKMFRYVKRFLYVSNEDAEDIVQDTFIQAYTYLYGYKPHFSFSSWLYRIAHNQCVTFLRKHGKRFASEQQTQQVADETGEEDSFFLSEENVADTVERQILQETVLKHLEALDPKSREILVLRFLEEKEYEEIADILRIPSGTVASLISRAKVKLKNIVHDN